MYRIKENKNVVEQYYSRKDAEAAFARLVAAEFEKWANGKICRIYALFSGTKKKADNGFMEFPYPET